MQLTQVMLDSIKKVEATRPKRKGMDIPLFSPEEKEQLLAEFHPDYRKSGFVELKVGANAGGKAPVELARLLNGTSRVYKKNINLDKIDYECDVLIIGGGGAGASAAIEALNVGAKPIIITKLRMGDANTMMAQGGIQAADKANDSPARHYVDAFGGGHFSNKPELLSQMVLQAPEAIKWLNDLGVMFDKQPDGTMITTHGGGTTRKRMHACRDYTGAEIMRVLRDEVINRGIEIVDFVSAIELILDTDGKAVGAVLQNNETGEILIAKAKTVIITTGGAGRLHYQGFPTSNHYGATADGVVMAYRAGAKLMYPDTLQYHPTGVAFPPQIVGALVTEKVRSVGAQILNIDGEAFMNPLETRDIASSSIIRECTARNKGIPTPNGYGVWLDTPLIEEIHGEGAILQKIPAMFRMYDKFGIDMRKVPILIYPTLHYQNGGIEIDKDCMSTIENLYVAGEAAGGIHGSNRLMGNSMLDIIVFGRIAGRIAGEKAKSVKIKKFTLDFVDKYQQEVEKAGVGTGVASPMIFPTYTHGNDKIQKLPIDQ